MWMAYKLQVICSTVQYDEIVQVDGKLVQWMKSLFMWVTYKYI
jgi:hypothetical protein